MLLVRRFQTISLVVESRLMPSSSTIGGTGDGVGATVGDGVGVGRSKPNSCTTASPIRAPSLPIASTVTMKLSGRASLVENVTVVTPCWLASAPMKKSPASPGSWVFVALYLEKMWDLATSASPWRVI